MPFKHQHMLLQEFCLKLPRGVSAGLRLDCCVGCAARLMKCSTIVPCLHVQTTAFPRLACELPASLVVLITRRLPNFIARHPLLGIHLSDRLRPGEQTSTPVQGGY